MFTMKFFFSVTAVAALSVNWTDAFSFTPTKSFFKTSSHLFMSDDFPSDSSSEDIVDVDSEEYKPTQSEKIVTSILDELSPEGGPTVSISKETRSSINEALLKLESMNPTSEPTSSSLLNGVWSLRYAGGYADDWALASPTRQLALFLYTGGYSPGLFALSLASGLPSNFVEVGDLEICE